MSKGKPIAGIVVIVGLALVGVGTLLTRTGHDLALSRDRLAATFAAQGLSEATYQSQVDAAVSKMQGYGHTEVQSLDALAVLLPAAHTPPTAFTWLETAANLAVVEDTDLVSAANIVVRVSTETGPTLAADTAKLAADADRYKTAHPS